MALVNTDGNERATLETLPEELSLHIIDAIKDLADSIGRGWGTRPKGALLRDSTLSSVSLVSSKLYSIWFPSLMENISISYDHLPSIHQVLQRNPHLVVKSLYCYDQAESRQDEKTEVPKKWILSGRPVTRRDVRALRAMLFESLVHLETLIVMDPNFLFDLTMKVNGKTVPLRFLTHSLKKLYLPLIISTSSSLALNARNAAWLLIFCSQLRQASLPISVTVEDFEFLKEYQDTIKGISKVKELSIRFIYKYKRQDRRTWWSLPVERSQTWIGGNKKTEIISRFLEITNQLTSLDLFFQYDDPNPGDGLVPNSMCLLGAYKSYESLVTLRLFEIGPDRRDQSSMDFSRFKNLKVLSSNFAHWDKVNLREALLPTKLQVVSLDFYMFEEGMPESETFEEERTLLKFLQSVSIPSLREVVVPFEPHHSGGWAIYPLDQKSRDIWTRTRKALKNADIFKSGQVELRTFKPGDSIVGRGETPISSLIWHPW